MTEEAQEGKQRLPREAPSRVRPVPEAAVTAARRRRPPTRVTRAPARPGPARRGSRARGPRTLGAAVAPVIVGTCAAVPDADGVIWWRAALALVVALALQVGVNYANDYSDGVRGTDTRPQGPAAADGVRPRVAARGAARRAARIRVSPRSPGSCSRSSSNRGCSLLGAASIAAAVLYTGGPKPYGYSGSAS